MPDCVLYRLGVTNRNQSERNHAIISLVLLNDLIDVLRASHSTAMFREW